MGKTLPHLAGRKQWQYTAWSMHYQWSTVVTAHSIKEARQLGLKEARVVFGYHARVHRDEVVPLARAVIKPSVLRYVFYHGKHEEIFMKII